MYILSILIVLIGSFWTWELLHYNFFIFLLIVFSSIVLFLSILKSSEKLLYIFFLILIPILITQWTTTANSSLSYMDGTDQQLFNTRRSEIPYFGRYTENKFHYIFYKFEQNLLRSADLNLFFFGNHPREISGIRNFEKYSFLLLPFFIFGLFKGLKSFLQVLFSLLIPLLELSVIGQNNPVGPFVLFPFFTSLIAIGIFNFAQKLPSIIKK